MSSNDLPRCVLVLGFLRPEDDRAELQRLTHWFANRVASGSNGSHQDVLAWLPVLRQLHQSRNPRPRQRTTVQQFMLDHPDTLTGAFVSQHAEGKGFTNVEKMNVRNKMAKTLLNTTYPHLKGGLDAKAGKQYRADIEEWNLSLPNISSAKDVARYVNFMFRDPHSLILELIGHAILFSTLYTLSFKRLGAMRVVMSP